MAAKFITKVFVLFVASCFSWQIFAATEMEKNKDDNQQSIMGVVSDTVITGKIKAKILLDKTLPTDIVVTTDKGIVSLSGAVNSDTEMSNIVEIAQATNGVKDVNTEKLTVKESKQPFTDILITAKIRGKMLQEKVFANKDVNVLNMKVETNNGVVYLSGTADNQQQIDNAIKIAKSVDGVKNVEAKIKVTESMTN